jgi:hypothetical protein
MGEWLKLARQGISHLEEIRRLLAELLEETRRR